jgi:hypothetical protein
VAARSYARQPSRHPRRAANHERRHRQAVVQAVPSHPLVGSRPYTFLVPLASRVDHLVRPPCRNPSRRGRPRRSLPCAAVEYLPAPTATTYQS